MVIFFRVGFAAQYCVALRATLLVYDYVHSLQEYSRGEKRMKILAFFKNHLEMLAKTTKKGYHNTVDILREAVLCGNSY